MAFLRISVGGTIFTHVFVSGLLIAKLCYLTILKLLLK